MAQDFPGAGVGEFSVFNRGHSVHQYVNHAFGVMVGILEGGRIVHLGKIEHHDVGRRSGTKGAAVIHAKHLGGHPAHAGNGLWKIQHSLLADIFAELPRVGTVGAGMRLAAAEGRQAAVRAGDGERLAHEAVDVVLVHVVGDDAGRVAAENVQHRVHRLHAGFIGAPGSLAGDFIQEASRSPVLNALGTTPAGDVFNGLFPDARAQFGILQPFAEGTHAALARPSRNQRRGKSGGRGGIRVLVGPNLHAVGAGGGKPADDFLGISPHVGSQTFDVAHHAGDSAGAGNIDDLLHGGDHPDVVIGFVADVAGVNPVVFRRDFGQFDDFPGFGKGAGGVKQTGREPESALFHRFPHHAPHRRHFRIGGRPVVNPAHGGTPDTVVADHEGDIHPGSGFLDRLALPGQIDRPSPVGIDDHRGDALGELGAGDRPIGIGQAAAGMRVGVDKSRSDVQSVGVNHLTGPVGQMGKITDGHDAAAANGHVGTIERSAGAIHNGPSLNQPVHRFSGGAGDGGGQRENGQD